MDQKPPDQPKAFTDRVIAAYLAVLWRHRPTYLMCLAIATAFWGYQARNVEMYSQFADLLPQGHAYIQAYNEHRTTFGGANIVTAVLQVNEGDIFTKEKSIIVENRGEHSLNRDILNNSKEIRILNFNYYLDNEENTKNNRIVLNKFSEIFKIYSF